MENTVKYYRYYSYDLWGNSKDGWEVNDVYWSPDIVALPMFDERFSDKDLAHIVRKSLNPKSRTQIDLHYSDDVGPIHIERMRDGKPLGELRLIEKEEAERNTDEDSWLTLFDKMLRNAARI